MCIILMLAAFSCAEHPQQAGEPVPIWDEVPFPIAAWIAFDEKFLDSGHFSQMAEAGFTISSAHYGDSETNLRALDLAREAGLKLVVVDRRIEPDKPVDEKALQELDNVCADYAGHPALFGYLVRDEPNAAVFSFMADIKKRLNLRDPRRLAFANLFPDYASEAQLGTATYQAHVDSFMQIYRPRILSYDYYPFTNRGFRKTYYKNMELIRQAALDAGVPFWAFTMSCEIDPAYPRPEEAWMRLQVYTDLAYGARGIQYFSYGVPHSDVEKFTIAVIDSNGNPTYIYDIAKRINAEILALAPELKRLRSVNVFHTVPLPEGTKAIPADFSVQFESRLPLTIGEFRNEDDETYLFLVNRDWRKDGEVRVRCAGDKMSVYEIDRKTGAPIPLPLEGNAAPLFLDAGDGKLLKLDE